MSSRRMPDRFRSLALRLSLWYGAIFSLSTSIALGSVYLIVVEIVGNRTDADMREDVVDYALLFQHGGIERVEREMVLDTQGEDAAKVIFRLWGSDGRQLFATDPSAWQDLDRVPEAVVASRGDGAPPVLDTLTLPPREHRVRRVVGQLAPGVVIEIAQSLENDMDFVAGIFRVFLMALATVVALGVPIGWFMARRALRGVEHVTRTANEIAAGALNRRVPVGTNGDEIDVLAMTFNGMLDRIEELIVGMRDMADNLAHDLRSPLTRIRTVAELSLTSSGSRGDLEALAVNTIEECDRVLEVVKSTLDIAEADAGAASLQLSAVNLSDLTQTACDIFQSVAEDNHIDLAPMPASELFVKGDRQRLQRVISNVIDNAIKYTAPGGQVRVSLQAESEWVSLIVEDTGVGIPAEELPRIFQRFFRGDRSRSTPGVGLGLNLAMAFVRAHGGDITVRSNVGVGTSFTIVLPRMQSATAITSSSALVLAGSQ
jgi:signal transduction histidine kinase